MKNSAFTMTYFIDQFPKVMSELMNHFIKQTGLTERLKTKTKMRALLEFLEPETTTGDIKKLLTANPALQEEMVRLLPTHRDQRHPLRAHSHDFTTDVDPVCNSEAGSSL